MKNGGKFILKKITPVKAFIDDPDTFLPESDVTIQEGGNIVQLEFIEGDEEVEKYIIKPGCFNLLETQSGVIAQKMELRKYDLLTSIDSTAGILSEADKFFTRLHVYDMLKIEPKRSLLLYSEPGYGKSASINQVCHKYLEDEGTVVLIWDTSSIKSQTINSFFQNAAEFEDTVKKLIFIMEDINGGSLEDYSGPRQSESSLLSLLDGVGRPFKGVPTFIIATTNNPENAVKPLIDRPGRFDKVIEVEAPTGPQMRKLLAFLKKSEVSDEDLESADLAAKAKFSISHLQETITRSLLDDISIMDAVKQLIEHKKRVGKAFAKGGKSFGFGE